MSPILFEDHAEQEFLEKQMLAHPREIGFEVDYGPLKVVIAVAIIIVVSLILIAAGSGEVPVYKVGVL